MKCLVLCGMLLSLLVVVLGEDLPTTTVNTLELDQYRCPFSMFDSGRPALLATGEIMFCDKDDVRCPNWYFCAAGYTDGRAVCCHILGP